VSRGRRFVLSFRTILRVGTVTTLYRWLTRATATNIYALQRFVRTLRQNLGAVEGAVTEPWRNGRDALTKRAGWTHSGMSSIPTFPNSTTTLRNDDLMYEADNSLCN
jgi:hypothetical protein